MAARRFARERHSELKVAVTCLSVAGFLAGWAAFGGHHAASASAATAQDGIAAPATDSPSSLAPSTGRSSSGGFTAPEPAPSTGRSDVTPVRRARSSRGS